MDLRISRGRRRNDEFVYFCWNEVDVGMVSGSKGWRLGRIGAAVPVPLLDRLFIFTAVVHSTLKVEAGCFVESLCHSSNKVKKKFRIYRARVRFIGAQGNSGNHAKR
jgi:hypothetical protein